MEPTDFSFSDIEGLYRLHGASLLLFAVSICNERSRAEDAVHQVFLKLAERRSLRCIADVKAYLFASVRNAIINDTKSQRRNVPIEPEHMWFEPPNRDYSAELNLRHALRALPEDQREVILMHIWGELTFSQIAQVLSISVNTAASRYRYAIAKLREAMLVKENSNVSS